MTENSTEPVLRRVRIESIDKGRRGVGHVIDLETGRFVYCKKVELTHEAGKNPVLTLQVMPEELECLIEGEAKFSTKKDDGVTISISGGFSGLSVDKDLLDLPMVDSKQRNKETNAGQVEPSSKQYMVSCAHAHKSLAVGDIVQMVETPKLDLVLLRISDMTLHSLEDSNDQYVHLVEMGATNGDSETA